MRSLISILDLSVAEIEELELAIHEARNLVPEPQDVKNKIVTLRAALDALQDPEAPVKEKNRLLKACIERITYSRERYTEAGTPQGMQETPIHLEFLLKV
jgi:hypothetical protein